MKLNKELSVLFDTVIVSKVTLNNQGDLLKVCLYSDHIIPYAAIKKATAAIKDSLFKNKNISVKLLQKYSLTGNYNLRVLMDVYKDSLQAELDDRDHRLSAAFRKADFIFSNDSTMNIVLPDTTGNHLKEKELIELLEKIFTERCGVDAILSVSYKPKETVEKNADEAMISRRIAAIAANAGILTAYSSETVENVGADVGAEATVAPAGAVSTEGTVKKIDRENRRALVRSDNPNVIFGREVDGEIIPMKDIVGEIGEVTVHGMVVATEERQIRNEKTIYFFDVTDFTDTFHLKIFVHNDQVKELSGKLKQGAFVKLKGVAMVDDFEHELTIGSIQGIQSIKDFRTPREDLAEEKRVELHCHTKMSDMDGVSDVSTIVKRAYKWGHRAIAITDHGVVQSFPEANHVWDDLWNAEKKKRMENGDANPDPDDFFKVIYGVEAYLVDDLKKCVGTELDETPIDASCVVFDLETTGLSAVSDRIIEFGAVKIKEGAIVDRFSAFVNPGFPIPFRITQLTSITDDMVMDADPIETVLPKFLDFVSGSYLVAHNAEFDTSFVRKNCERQGLSYDFNHVDTLMLSKVLLPHLAKYTLDSVAKDLGVSLLNHHRAVDDAECTANIYIKLCEMLKDRGITNLAGVGKLKMDTAEFVKKNRSHHAIILAKNNVGRVNLYKLISMSHLFYMRRGKPCVPKSLLIKNREGLILGSACEAGELYDELLHGANEAEIARLVDFYDYLEIQPVGNNMFMILSDKHENINSVEDIQDVNRRIVELGEVFNKPVVATCDVHFLDPEDEIYRRILMAGEGFKDADNQAPLYLHTTEEMLKEFSYLGYEKAKEIVIKNPNRIADMCDKISPVRPDKCPPVIENSDKLLRDICYNKAHEM
ncbi:MAG: exonuclease domain-containing protein, partial [Lachnospiraceae bacterium]|nr:exonuclease domain-containing protein [Lachnospiraceae bacterium]